MRRLLAVAVATAAALLAAGCSSDSPSADRSGDPLPVTNDPSASVVHGGPRYLALGDSVPFGYREPDSLPTAPDYADPTTFVGYPQLVAEKLGFALTNLSCPGETSASFLDPSKQSNGCENRYVRGSGAPVADGYRTLHPLHTSYSGSQLAAGQTFLRQHPDTGLVTLMIGANDAFVCQKSTADKCVGEIGTLLGTVSANAATVLRGLRETAHYRGQIVVVGYYSTDYTDPLVTGAVRAIDAALATAGKPYGVTVADGFAAVGTAAAKSAGKTCAAGLLTHLSTSPPSCGVHPTAAGAALLAGAVEKVVTAPSTP